MEISYKRSANSSYMVLYGGLPPKGYEERMLRENDIDVLLPFYTTETDGRFAYWYNISGRISLADSIGRRGISAGLLSSVLRGISIALRTTGNYLICEEHISLSPETIYMTETPGEPLIFLSFFPEDTPQGLLALTEHLIRTVDHSREREMRLCYDLYDMAASGRATIGDMLERIDRDITGGVDGYVEQSVPVVREETDRCIQIRREPSLPDTGEICASGDAEHRGLLDRVLSVIGDMLKDFWVRIKDAVPPLSHRSEPTDIMEVTDLVYEPDAMLYEPTVMLEAAVSCEGRLIYDGKGRGEDIRIMGEGCRIGSMAQGNDAVISSAAVSRHHAVITFNDGEYYIEDMNSTNGTFVNDSLLAYKERVKLSVSDRVRFADVSYRFV